MQTDGHIRLLPLHVANKIAAGEVVERPASVLKELLENALDAGATRIDVDVSAGGRKLVSVRDNGCGMNREDALLSLERQATSKIRDVDDIERISTLGFRGEAVPSIASVSRFTLTTRRIDAEGGTRLVVNAGTLAEVKECGAPPGTCVEVRDLFCNVPARRKFLRAFATEEGHIRTTFTLHALAHPDVGFALTLDGREIYRFPPGATLEERVRDIFGAPFAESLLPVEGTTGDVHIHGYVERPDRDTLLRRDQFVFINGRPATAPAVAYALREAYPRQRAEARPAVVLFIDLPPTQVDVNVHPAKREVRFRRPADVREAIISAITHTLTPSASLPSTTQFSAPPSTSGTSTPFLPTSEGTQPFVVPFSLSPQSQQQTFSLPTPPKPCTVPESLPIPPPPPQPQQQEILTEPLQTSTGPWRWFKFLAQTQTGWVLLETDAGIVILNPRAARERIVYEQLIDANTATTQPLLIPETVTLPPPDSARIRNFQKELTSLGFAIEEFGRDIWKIDAIPSLLGSVSARDLLASIASDIAESGAKRGGARWRDELVAKSVAKSFSGAALQLTSEGATKLIEELAATRMPYICPRGKPIMIFKSNAEILRVIG